METDNEGFTTVVNRNRRKRNSTSSSNTDCSSSVRPVTKKPAHTSPAPTHTNKPDRTNLAPLFVEITDPNVNTAKIHYDLSVFCSSRRRTQAGSLLAYPKSPEARYTLLNREFEGFRCRETRGNGNRSHTTSQTGSQPRPAPRENLFIVVSTTQMKTYLLS